MLYFIELVAQAKASIENTKDMTTLDSIRIEYLGKKGHVSTAMKSLAKLPNKDRPAAGAIINQVKKEIQNILNVHKKKLALEVLNSQLSKEKIDVSLPGRRIEHGGLHPVTRTIDCIETFFIGLGFSLETGPEIEDDYHNFDALNIPAYHPARTEHDTFWFDSIRLLRTQTSVVQIRAMEKAALEKKNRQISMRIIASGRVYRNDNDQTHTPMFHQMEGLVIDQNINFANLKAIVDDFFKHFFEEEWKFRFRPSYFPFTEPSAEVDIMGRNGKWLEVLGCGMLHPNVLRNVRIDPEIYSAFAFGMGIERLTMLRYGVTDLRAFFENDLRFLKQFK